MIIPPFNLPSPLHEIHIHPGTEKQIRLRIKRDDQIHAEVSGNKWRKLKYNIEFAVENKKEILLSAGGYWSNHLAALAAAGKIFDLKTVGFVRGEQPSNLNETLSYCNSVGMELIFVTRSEFRNLQDNAEYKKWNHENTFFIPMGGENQLGIKGCGEIMKEVDEGYTHIVLPVGTGTTLKGIADKETKAQIIGISVLKGWNETSGNYMITDKYSMDGFAKSNPTLNEFILDFFQQNKIALEPVYTGKMMFGLYQMLEDGYFEPGSDIICIHTGGLQGLAGYPDLHKAMFTK